MDFSSFVSDIIAGLITTGIIGGITLMFGFKPLERKLDSFEKRLDEKKGNVLDKVSGVYLAQIDELSKQRQAIFDELEELDLSKKENTKYTL